MFWRIRSNLSCILVPILFLVFSGAIIEERGGHYFKYVLDPDYTYFMNSHALARGRTPRHNDHPGVPVQIVGAVVQRAWHVSVCMKTWATNGGTCASFGDAVLLNPERILNYTAWTLTLLNSLGLLLLGLFLKKSGIPNLVGWAAQISILAYGSTASAIGRVWPEGFMIFPSALLAWAFLPHVMRNEKKLGYSPTKHALFQGIAIGFGIANKLTFAPLALSVFLFVRKKTILICTIGIILGFLVTTSPIWSRFPYMFDWVLQLSRGRAAETIEVSAWSEMLLFLKSEKILIVVGTYICFAIGFATFTKKKLTNDGAIRFLAVYLAILACTAVMLSKRPNSYYLIPVLASGLPVLCVVIWRLFSVAPETRKKDLLIPKIAFVVVTGLMFFGPLVSTLQYDFRLLTQLRKDRIEHEKIPRKYNHCTLIGTYTSSLISYALAYGNSWAHELFNQDLRRLYPKFIQFRENGYSGFGNFGLPVSLDSLRKRVRDGECIFFYGSSGLGEQPPKSHEKFTLKAKESSGSETLFEILEIQGKH